MNLDDRNRDTLKSQNLGFDPGRSNIRGSAANSVRGSKSYLQAVTEGEPEQPDATLLPPPSPSGYKICSGFIENENLHWLERALVGVCKKYSEPEDVEKLMREDGRNGISIRRVVGCHDLIYFEMGKI